MSRIEQATFTIAVATATMCIWFAPASAFIVVPTMALYVAAAADALWPRKGAGR